MYTASVRRSGVEPRLFHLVLIKPSHYDDDGYPIRWIKAAIPSNTLACLNGLAAAGREGVVRLFEILEDEVRICLSLLGVTSYAELDKSYVRAAPAVVSAHVHSPFPHLDLPIEKY